MVTEHIKRKIAIGEGTVNRKDKTDFEITNSGRIFVYLIAGEYPR